MTIRTIFASRWRASIAAQLFTIIQQNQEIIKLGTTANTTISKVAAQVTQLQTDFGTFQPAFSAFVASVQAFIASATAPASESTLSQADQDALNAIGTEAATLDTAVQGMNTALAGVSIPTPATPPASS